MAIRHLLLFSHGWVRLLSRSSRHPNDHLRPNVNLYLEHVYGYNSSRSRNNLFYNSNLEVIYPVATAGIIYSKSTNTQKFFQGHEAEIISLAIDPTGKYVVSGEAGKNYRKALSATTGIEICSLQEFNVGIPWVAFSSSKDLPLICSIGCEDNNSVLAVYGDAESFGEWTPKIELLASQTIGESAICCCFVDRVAGSPMFDIFTGCKEVSFFWRLTGAGLLVSTKATFGRVAKAQPQICGAILGENLLTGTASGQMYLWENAHVSKVIPGHRSMISSMHVVGRQK